jgi:phenylacetic acid degradation operon negative regulatory protein
MADQITPQIDEFEGRDERRASAKSLLTTILGEFVRPHGATLWTTTAVAALETLGVTERNARQALARSRDQGLILPERRGRTVRWRLTDAAAELLTAGAERIYGFGTRGTSWDGHWLVVMCSIPERQRAKRHKLRTQLTFEGFGFVAASVAVCPYRDRQPAADAILRGLGLDGEALTLVARTGELTPDSRMVASAWQLDSLADAYVDFIAEFEPVAPRSPEEAFRATVELVDAWRHFPFRDPDLPAELLPADWPGRTARELFTARRQEWSAAALEWFRRVQPADGRP